MKKIITLGMAASLLLALSPVGAADPTPAAAKPAAPAAAKPAAPAAADAKTTNPADSASAYKTTNERFSYMIGYQVGAQIKGMGDAESITPDVLSAGLRDGMAGKKPALSDKEIEDTMQVKQAEAMKAQQEAQQEFEKQGVAAKADGEKFLKENAKKEGVKTTKSGLQYKILTEGKGKTPGAGDSVTVHYEGKLVDGKVFDSSLEGGEPRTFQVNQVVPGWTEALQMMKVGSKYELAIPANLGYGAEGRMAPKGEVGIPPNSVLRFTVELLDTKPAPPQQGLPSGHPPIGGMGGQGMPR